MERLKSKVPCQYQGINPTHGVMPTSSPPMNAADMYSRRQYPNRHLEGSGGGAYYRAPPPPPIVPRHRVVYRRQVDDDVAAAGGSFGFYNGADVWGPYPNIYRSEPKVLKGLSPQNIQRPPQIKAQNYKFVYNNSDWSPVDDNIQMNPTFTASREDFNACIDFTLYGPSQRKRLPVFTYICPE